MRFAIGLGAIVIMFESLRARQYAFTALFAAIVLFFNPLLPLFALSGNGLILFASVLPFVASLFRATHPSIATRIEFANSYKPWERGMPPVYGDVCKSE